MTRANGSMTLLKYMYEKPALVLQCFPLTLSNSLIVSSHLFRNNDISNPDGILMARYTTVLIFDGNTYADRRVSVLARQDHKLARWVLVAPGGSLLHLHYGHT